MGSVRDTLITILTVVTDTLWIFPVLGMCGYILEQGGSPLPAAMVFGLIVAAIVVTRAIRNGAANSGGEAVAQALLGLSVIYVAMSFLAVEDGFDLLWGPRMVGGGLPGRTVAGLIIASAMAGVLWFRGVRIAVETRPQARLVHTFRAGIIGLAIAILAEQTFDAYFYATVMIVPFFAISLAALAFARMASAAAWPRTIGLAVSTVIGGGLLIGLIGAAFGGSGLKLLVAGWNYFLAGLSWVLTVLLAPVLEAIFSFVLWLIGDNVPPNRADRVISPQERDWWQHLEPDSVPPFVELVIQLLKYPALLAAIYLLYRLLLWAYRAHIAHIVTAAAADRESIRGEANAAADLANLALGLLPDWMFRGAADPGPRYPKDRPGITEVFALYFDMLSVACDRGYEVVSSMTPRERRPDLEHAIPGAPVGPITECFNDACYGNIGTDRTTADRLRDELETVANAPLDAANTAD